MFHFLVEKKKYIPKNEPAIAQDQAIKYQVCGGFFTCKLMTQIGYQEDLLCFKSKQREDHRKVECSGTKVPFALIPLH
jgi:hypothetical protein